MIWTLLKALLFFTLIAAITWGASLLLESGEGLRIAAAGYEFTLGPLQAVIGLLLIVLGLWLALKLIGLVLAILRFAAGMKPPSRAISTATGSGRAMPRWPMAWWRWPRARTGWHCRAR